MFCKSHPDWIMPNGLIQTILCAANIEKSYNTLYENFYYTMVNIVNSIKYNFDVYNPTNGELINYRESDTKKIENYYNRLNKALSDIKISDADKLVDSFNNFFNTDFFKKTVLVEDSRFLPVKFDDTEKFIDEIFDINDKFSFDIDCKIKCRNFREMNYDDFISKYSRIPHDCTITCSISNDCEVDYDEVYWKVRNVGPLAESLNQIRGQILSRGNSITETSLFYGDHYVECYLIKNNICIAISHKDIFIGDK